MALNPFFGGRSSGTGSSSHTTSDSIFDPFFDFSIFAPQVSGSDQAKQFAKDVSAVANTRVDWVETPEAHVFKADLPGLAKEEIKISIDDSRTLQISGERKREEVDKRDKYHRVERAHGSFLRRFRLPENANLDAIKAEVNHGVLKVTVPKAEKPKPQVRSISVE